MVDVPFISGKIRTLARDRQRVAKERGASKRVTNEAVADET